jgi:hypothetical protein
MKLKTALLLLVLSLATMTFSQPMADAPDETSYEYHDIEKKKLNFFIVSKRKKGSFDLASRFNVFRTKMKSLFRPKKFVAIVGEDAEQASRKIEYRLLKYDANIGTIWFDSHGMYKKGYSLFYIGKDEYSYLTLKDSCMMAPMQKLSAYANEETKLVIGSCYGGATYQRSSIDYSDTTRMNGDSLMIALGKIFKQGNVYASESWVMTKPGLFLKKAAVAGFPGRKLFLDLCYQPAWESVGKWNEYNAATETFTKINPITLDMYGNAIVRTMAYTDKESVKKDIEKNLGKLQPGLYK